MKTMTCRQLGGPCNLEHQGQDANDVINAQDRHLKEGEKAGDTSHQEARDAMKRRWLAASEEVLGLVQRHQGCLRPTSQGLTILQQRLKARDT